MYFEDNRDLASDPKELRVRLLGEDFRFWTDNGVFSKSGVDFGSRLLIETFEPSVGEGTLLDVGCGYGVIGIALAKSYGLSLTGVDVNPRALDLAQKNALSNLTITSSGLSESLQRLDEISDSLSNLTTAEFLMSDGLSALTEQKFSDVVTNPPIRAGKEVVHRILSESFEHLTPGGSLWVVIQKKQGAPSAVKKLEEVFGNVEKVKQDKGYWILRSVKKG